MCHNSFSLIVKYYNIPFLQTWPREIRIDRENVAEYSRAFVFSVSYQDRIVN